MTLTAGSTLGPYEILSPLGAGGMGEVYRARDPRLGRDVEVKVLPHALSADVDALARFEWEAKAVAALSHQNILSIFDFGNQDGIAFAVMEPRRSAPPPPSEGPSPFLRQVLLALRQKYEAS